MKGQKIDNLLDPKWLGKKIIKSTYEYSWIKILYQGNKKCFAITNCGTEFLVPRNDSCDGEPYFDWHEWIEPTEENEPINKIAEPQKFPFKIGDKIRLTHWDKHEYAEVVNEEGKISLNLSHSPWPPANNASLTARTSKECVDAFTNGMVWELYVEDEPEFPFKVGDKIAHTNFPEHVYIEILQITRLLFHPNFGFRIHAKTHSYFNAEIVEENYNIKLTEIEDWKLWENHYSQEPKKKKTILFNLKKTEFLLQEDSPKFTMYSLHGYESESVAADLIRSDPNTIQFPAVTKDGTVLEFEVDDE